jgi:hypothetical protein
VTSFEVLPYTAYWQPETPTYAPAAVALELSHPDVNSGAAYYKSEPFPMVRVTAKQVCCCNCANCVLYMLS